MKATCPHCGVYGSVELFLADADAKKAAMDVNNLPGQLPRLTWSYVGLFRKPGSAKGMPWSRVGRIVAELAGLVAEVEIQWKGQRVVPNRPEFWAQGITAMLDRDAQGKLERPLDGHNYLRAVAYEIAEKAWHQGNVAREEEAKRRPAPPQGQSSSPPTRTIAPTPGRGASTQTPFTPVPMSEALRGWRERLNGDQQ